AVPQDARPGGEMLPRDRPPEVEGETREQHPGRLVAPLERADQEGAVGAGLQRIGRPGADRPLRGLEAVGLGHEQAFVAHACVPPGTGIGGRAHGTALSFDAGSKLTCWMTLLERQDGRTVSDMILMALEAGHEWTEGGRPIGRPPRTLAARCVLRAELLWE